MKELDQFIKSNVNLYSMESIHSIISIFKSLSDVSQPQYIRRAAFLGYSQLANIIKLSENELEENAGKKSTGVIKIDSLATVCIITQNILNHLKDNDAKVVCSAAETLYNIMKYFPHYVINLFNDIFKGLLLIHVNPDQEVRTLAQNLDSLLKEIINFSFQDNQL
jgi:hypothetical protein